VVCDLAPGLETVSLALAPEGQLIGLVDLATIAETPLLDRPWLFVKTSIGSIESHVALVEILVELAARYLADFELIDEGGYWPDRDAVTLARRRGEGPGGLARAGSVLPRVQRAFRGLEADEVDALDEPSDEEAYVGDEAELLASDDPLVATIQRLTLDVLAIAREGYLDAGARGVLDVLGGAAQAGPAPRPGDAAARAHLARALRGASVLRGDLVYAREDGIVDARELDRLLGTLRDVERDLAERLETTTRACAPR
jgi:hypothetical protein